ncbi:MULTISPECIES: excinuclease ATPase subunit [unclassified Microbulbifer]|uniref:excinuclease ATPase subunit n=1 Tax=unclassified Microbulbifer TaxID=2619833 RepID=UPI0027E3C1C9|nr:MULTISPECIES: excinuclease ATPase subunit [unclassified Microbulbifer]
MMKRTLASATAVLLLITLNTAQARDTRHMLSIQDALSTPDAKAKLDGDIQLQFGAAPKGTITQRHGEFTANKKTNAFNKSDTEACRWVFLSAMIALQDRARREGGNAVVNIRSYYKKNEINSPTEFECGAGAVMAGVTLKGEVVTLK